jgi:hypothetical protein
MNESTLVLHEGGLHRRTVVENFEPVELSQLQGHVDQSQQELDQATANLLSAARSAESVEELSDARDTESKAQAALAEAKSEFEVGQGLVAQSGDGSETGTEETDGSVEDQY